MWVNGGNGDTAAYFCRSTGALFHTGDEYDLGDQTLPSDLDDTTKFAAVPDKRTLELGTHLVFDFAQQQVSDRYDEIRTLFSRRGAYRRWKARLEREGLLGDWHEYQKSETSMALTRWAESEGFEVGQ